MSVKGHPMPKRTVLCTRCKTTPLLRAGHFSDAKCPPCVRELNKIRTLGKDALTRAQARRYRILLAVSPYETYEALLNALRIRNPRTREHHFDLTVERRAGKTLRQFQGKVA